jgi:4-hydroxy-3-polyprenylbenzoate decarboxylase|tara:strand:+ start:937 stop:1128 length:192 start_codon:yes stop_codon:yes gene_type:complete
MRPIAIALTDPSGMPYAITLLKQLVKAQDKIYVMISQAASIVITMETDLNLGADIPSIKKILS